jgi:anti-sigma factor (TIGR02949 family)
VIPCSEAVEQLWDYLDREVSARDRAAVEEHLAFCRRCCGEVEFAEELRGLLTSASRVELPADVEAALDRALDDLVADAAHPAPAETIAEEDGGARP